ncbi:diacylglycerol/lipid kinase family protein [Guggenheimella bovis]
MKRIHIIVNRNSVKEKELMKLSFELLVNGYTVSMHETTSAGDATNNARDVCDQASSDLILSFGGDGTLNEVVRGILSSAHPLPVTAFAGGTMNDFVSYLKLPKDATAFAKTLGSFSMHAIDVLKINDQFGINVFAAGALPAVAHSTSSEEKAIIGPLAYYLEGIRKLPDLTKDHFIDLETDEYLYRGPFMLFLANNSKTTGGFSNLAPEANITDGLLDCLLIKKVSAMDLAEFLLKLSRGEKILSEDVVYFKANRITVISDADFDIDGEFLDAEKALIEVKMQALSFLY